MAITRYLVGSLLGSLVVVWHAVLTREQFYPAMEYLSTSKISLAVLGNMGFAGALLTYHIVTKAFLGTLRDYEMERVNDRVGQAIIETLLAMTIFRQNLESFSLLSQFVILAFMKIFHWLAQDRVDFIETSPNVTVLQHIRLASMIMMLMIVDLFMLHLALGNTFTYGVSVYLLFAFEYSMQTSMAMAVLVKYIFSLVDLRMHGNWRGKSVAVFYVDLTRDLVHLITYSAFFFVVFSTYGIPIHLIRDIYWTFRNFQSRVSDFLRYRQISANMENRFPDATEEDLERVDHMCIVCREEMVTSAKRLPCNHVFHLDCLKSWLERQQNCPICRTPISASDTREERERAGAGAPAGAAAAAGGGGAPPPPPAPAPAPAPAPDNNDEVQNTRDGIEIGDTAEEGEEGSRQRADGEGNVPRDPTASDTRLFSTEEEDEERGKKYRQAQEARDAFLRRLEQQRNDNDDGEPSTPQEDSIASPERINASSPPKQEDPREDPPPSSHHAAGEQPTSHMPLLFTYPTNVSPLFFPTPAQVEEEENLVQSILDEMGVQPTEEQHARALSIARAAAQAATAAYALQQQQSQSNAHQ